MHGTFNETLDTKGAIGGQEDIVFQSTCEDMYRLNQMAKTGQYNKVVKYFTKRGQGALFELRPVINEENKLKIQFESYNLRFAIEHFILTEANMFNKYTTCRMCNEPIILQRRTKKFCSDACRMAYNRKYKNYK